VTGYFSEIWRLRHFWLALVRIDLRKRYRRSIIGMGWSLLQPIAMMLILCIVFSQLLKVNMHDFAPFLLSGLTCWGFLAAVVSEGCHCFLQGEPYIRQQPAPLAIYALRTTLGAGFHFILGFLIVLVFVWWLMGFGHFAMLPVVLPSFALFFIFGWAMAVCMGLANVMFQDSEHLIQIALQIFFYATPIIYPPEMVMGRRLVSWLIRANPFAAFLELVRAPLLNGTLPSTWAVGMSVGATAIAVILAVLALKRFEKRLIFYL
jgi:ABC-type polysaccharide/polyol phosphate export permease